MENNELVRISEYFEDVEITEEYDGYLYKIGEAITITIIGSFCGFKNLSQIHTWAAHEKNKEILSEKFGVKKVPCYYWLTQLIGLVDPKSMNEKFMEWVLSYLPESLKGMTISFDGKTIRSTCGMHSYESPLHIVSAQIAEFGLTFAQEAVESKKSEIPAVQRLMKMLKIEGCMVVADALNCQTETARAIVEQKADYLLSVKDNQPTLKADIEGYIQDEFMRKKMDTESTKEKNRGRIEERIAFATDDINWMECRKNWENLACIGAINTKFTTSKGTSNEWHYYISSKKLTAKELLKYARNEWSVESMHWLLDVHFHEDFCRVQDENIQKNLNIIRKIVINSMRLFKNSTKSKKPFSHIMIDCLIDPSHIAEILSHQN
jgi:predicted transposase YbfD/YdcC